MSNFITEIKDSDFNKMKFNINTVPLTHKIVDYFPELRIYPEFNDEDIEWEIGGSPITLSRDEMSRFIIFSYDPNSPLLQFPDISERKKLAYQRATGKTSRVPQYIIEAMNGNCQGVNDILKCFFKILNQRNFELWITATEFFAELTESVRQPIPPGVADDKMAVAYKNKNQNMNDAIALNEKIATLETHMFDGNEDLQKIITQTEPIGNKGALEMRQKKRIK